MRILVTGGRGMLGRTLARRLPEHDLDLADLPDFDITSAEGVARRMTSFRPEVVVHCAAMTAVDLCEGEEDKAVAVNALGSANVAAASSRAGARLVAISTDYVFSGDLDRPYHEWDAPAPRTAYGRSKLWGEEAVRRHCPDHVILRIAWLYGPGGPSFAHTMLRLAREGQTALKVVADQVGNPTSTDAVAGCLRQVLVSPVAGTFHATCEGEASWCDFARAVFEFKGLSVEVRPCTTAEYPRPAPRPANSRLEKRALRLAGLPPMPHWKTALADFFREFPEG